MQNRMILASNIAWGLSGLCIGYVFGELHNIPGWLAFTVALIGRYLLQKVVVEPLFESELAVFKKWREKHPVETAFWLHAHNKHEVKSPLKCEEGDCIALLP
jgi:hypothetical protein